MPGRLHHAVQPPAAHAVHGDDVVGGDREVRFERRRVHLLVLYSELRRPGRREYLLRQEGGESMYTRGDGVLVMSNTARYLSSSLRSSRAFTSNTFRSFAGVASVVRADVLRGYLGADGVAA